MSVSWFSLVGRLGLFILLLFSVCGICLDAFCASMHYEDKCNAYFAKSDKNIKKMQCLDGKNRISGVRTENGAKFVSVQTALNSSSDK